MIPLQNALIIFDCDGTLVDSQHMIVDAMNAAFAAQKLHPPSRLQTLAIVGLSLPQAFARLAGQYPLAVQQQLAEGYKEAYRLMLAMPVQREPLYDGIAELVKALHGAGATLGVATGKSRMGLNRVLADHNLTPYFATLQTADDAASKPNPEMLHRCARETGLPLQSIIMIGDTSFDMHMARAAGARAIGVTWGYHSVDELNESGAHVIAHSVEDLRIMLIPNE